MQATPNKKTLVIAEKRTVGKVLARHLGCKNDHGTWIEGAAYDVVWAQGHLMRLLLPEEYKEHPEWSNSGARLPIDPGSDGWRWKSPDGGAAAEQFNCMATLLQGGSYGRVIHACDPDREGQAIADLVLRELGCTLPVDRLWCSSLEDAALAKAFAQLKPNAEYQGLLESAILRSKSDWLVGMNASRLYSRNLRSAQSVGRVRTPTLALVVARDRAIEAFSSAESYRVALNLGDGLVVLGEACASRKEAQDRLEAAKMAHATIVGVQRKKATEGSPALLNTTGAQKLASERFGMSPDACDKALQSLYERGLITYPRTDSCFVNTEDGEDLEQLICLVNTPEHVGADTAKAFSSMPHDASKVVDDSKVEGHGALLPTTRLTSSCMQGLKGDDALIAGMICESLLAAVAPDRVLEKTGLDVVVEGQPYRATSSLELEAGWKKLRRAASTEEEEGDETASRIPENLVPGMELPVLGGDLKTVKSTPPKRFTDATLLAAMEHAERFLDEDDLRSAIKDSASHSGGLGTPATRAGIIASLVDRGYLERKRTTLISTAEGRALIDTVDPRLKDVRLTASMERDLAAIEREGADPEAFMQGVTKLVHEVVAAGMAMPRREAAPTGEPIGRCPQCGGRVLDNGNPRSPYLCENVRRERTTGPDGTPAWKSCGTCSFKLPRTFMGAEISAASAKKLLAGKMAKVKGLARKDSSTIDRLIELDCAQGYRPRIARDQSVKVGVCPKCGGDVVDVGNDKVPYLCEHNKKDAAPGEQTCDFRLGREHLGKKLPKADIPKLLKGETVLVKGLTSKRDGSKFEAYLALDPQRDWSVRITGYPKNEA